MRAVPRRTYFPDKAAVHRALVDRFLGQVDLRPSGDEPWRERIHALARDVRERLSAYPAVVPLLVGGPMDGPATLALGEHLLAVLAGAGLEPDDAARASYLIMVYVLGAVALEVAEHTAPGHLPPERERIIARRAALAATPADAYPRTAGAGSVIAEYVSTDQFRWGLDRVLDGLVVRASVPTSATNPSHSP